MGNAPPGLSDPEPPAKVILGVVNPRNGEVEFDRTVKLHEQRILGTSQKGSSASDVGAAFRVALKGSSVVDQVHDPVAVAAKAKMSQFELGPGYDSEAEWFSYVGSLRRGIESQFRTSVLAMPFYPSGDRARHWPVGARPYSCKMAQLGTAINQLLIPRNAEENSWQTVIPTKFVDVKWGEAARECASAGIARASKWTLYLQFNGKYLLVNSKEDFVRLTDHPDGYSRYAVREAFHYRDACVARDRQKCLFISRPYSEMTLFVISCRIAQSAGYPLQFHFYVSCRHWLQNEAFTDPTARAYLLTLIAESDRASYVPEFDPEDLTGEKQASDYLNHLIDLLEDERVAKKFRDALATATPAQKAAAAADLSRFLLQGPPETFKPGNGVDVYWQPETPVVERAKAEVAPVKKEEEAEVVELPAYLDGRNYSIDARVLGRFPCVYRSNALHMVNASPTLNMALNALRTRQLQGSVEFLLAEFRMELDSSVYSVPTRRMLDTQGEGWCQGMWFERGRFEIQFRGLVARPTDPDAMTGDAALCRAYLSQTILECAHRRAQPGCLLVQSEAGLRPFRDLDVLTRSPYLDSFFCEGGVTLSRAFYPKGHPDEFGQMGSLGCGFAFTPGLVRILRHPNLSVTIENRQGERRRLLVMNLAEGVQAKFPLVYDLDVSLFDPSLKPEECYLRMVAGANVRVAEILARDLERGKEPQLDEEEIPAAVLAAWREETPSRKRAPSFARPEMQTVDHGASEQDMLDELNVSVAMESVGHYPNLQGVGTSARRAPRGGRRGSARIADKHGGIAFSSADPTESVSEDQAWQQAQAFWREPPEKRSLFAGRLRLLRDQGALTWISKGFTWEYVFTRVKVSPTVKAYLEADLRDLVLGRQLDPSFELLDPRLLMTYLVSGPVNTTRPRRISVTGEERKFVLPSSFQSPRPEEPSPAMKAVLEGYTFSGPLNVGS